ncbi:hypothetical protein [Streptomyces sp. NPDC059701]|uniref:hypothetical protein n=1 Tax=Streptomyces sp. NPDC059701 TaxID=3346914 RepID=UPI0036741FF2
MGRGRIRWGPVTAVAALPVLLPTWLVVAVVRFSTSDHPLGGGPEEVPCAEAPAFGGAEPPAGAYDTECTVRTWLDTSYYAAFRMPRSGVGDRLTHTYGERPGTSLCSGGGDVCLNLDGAAHPPPAGVGANAVTVDVVHESAGTARVRFSAFTV